MYCRPMSHDAKILSAWLGAFYGVGAVLGLLAYAFNSFEFFAFIGIFWIKETMAIVGIGMSYWLYCIILGFLNRPPKAPLRTLGRMFLAAGAWFAFRLLIHG
jgi:hypothetical protein